MNGSKWLMTQHVQRSRYDMSSDFNRKFDLQQFCQFDKKTLAPKQHGKLVGNRSKSSSHRNVIENFVDIHSLTDMSNFQPEGLELMAMPINAYYRSSNHSGGNQNPNNQKPLATQPPKNVRNGPQAPPKQPDQPIQLLKRDTDDEKDLQVMTPTPTPSHPPQLNVVPPTNAAANPSIEQQAEVNVLQQPQPMPYVQYYYPSADCVDPNCYPAEMMPAQPIYQMQAPAYAAAPIPMQAAGPFGVPQAMPANHVYTMPMAATWPGQANPTAYYVAAPNPPMPVSIPTFAALPIRHRELLRCHGRVNFNPSPSVSPNGSDLPRKYSAHQHISITIEHSIHISFFVPFWIYLQWEIKGPFDSTTIWASSTSISFNRCMARVNCWQCLKAKMRTVTFHQTITTIRHRSPAIFSSN